MVEAGEYERMRKYLRTAATSRSKGPGTAWSGKFPTAARRKRAASSTAWSSRKQAMRRRNPDAIGEPRPYVLAAASLALCESPSPFTRAQAYPTKPIRMFSGFLAGGANDYHGRVVAQKMTDLLGQTVIVENRAGRAARSPRMRLPRPRRMATPCCWASARSRSPPACMQAAVRRAQGFLGRLARLPHPERARVPSALPAKNVKELIALAHRTPAK